jgi:hypothetical protein
MVAAATLSFAPLVARSDTAAPAVEVAGAWVRATVPGQQVAGAYLTLRSMRSAEITGVKSPVAKSAEIHSMSNEGGVMRMRKLEKLELPAGQRVELKPDGNHIMLFDIKRQLRPGETVPITLILRQSKKNIPIEIQAPVREAQ